MIFFDIGMRIGHAISGVVSTEQSFSMFFVYLIILWSLKFSHLQIKRAELFRLDQQVIRYWKLGWFFSSLDLFVSIILLDDMGRNNRVH